MLSRSRFEKEATSLVTALKTVRAAADGGRSTLVSSNELPADFLLVDWTLEVDERGGGLFLRHPSVASAPKQTFQEAENDASPSPWPDNEDDPSDDTIFIDTAQFHVPSMNDDEPDSATTISFYFSIVYSETYQVPVLYFHAQHPFNGEPCSRTHVMRFLFPGDTTTTTTSSSSSGDSWEFVSQEPHPHTGFPSYFLHPCRTSERLQLLRQQLKDDKVHYLWAWMSMIFPAVGFSIPSQFYQKVQDSLCGSQVT